MSEIVLMVNSFILFVFLAFTLRQMKVERTEWTQERKDLLNRIQAASYVEYMDKVLQEKMLDRQETKPKDKYVEDNFIS